MAAAGSISSDALAPQVAGSRWTDWRFWLPTLLLGLVIFTSHGELRYAREAAGAPTDTDLVEVVGSNNAIRQLAIVCFSFFGCALLVSHRGRQLRSRWLLAAMGTAVAFTVSSAFWSAEFGTSLKRTAIIALVFVATMGIGRMWSARDLVGAVFLITGSIIAVSLAAETAFGTFMATADHRFSGIMHSNRQSTNCGMFTLSAISLSLYTRQRWWLGFAALGLILIVLCGSRGGLISICFAILFMLQANISWNKRIWAVILGAALLGGLLIHLALDPFGANLFASVSTLGRDAAEADPTSLTGRIPIWENLLREVSARPLLGAGYGTFWLPKTVDRLSKIHNWQFQNAHNLYLETMLDVGAIGLVLLLFAVAAIFLRGLRARRVLADPAQLFVPALIAMGAVSGLTEAIFVSIGIEFIAIMTGGMILAHLSLSQPIQHYVVGGWNMPVHAGTTQIEVLAR